MNITKLYMIWHILGSIIVPIAGYFTLCVLKPDSNKLNLVFDIDHTLIHSQKCSKPQTYFKPPDYDLMVNTGNSYTHHYYVWRRPFSKIILRILSKFNNLHVYTASMSYYANPILENLFPDIQFKNRLYRDSMVGGKDLCKISNDDSNMVLFDDKIDNHVNKKNNFYNVSKYHFSNKNDFEMLKIFCFVLTANFIGIENVKKIGLFKSIVKN